MFFVTETKQYTKRMHVCAMNIPPQPPPLSDPRCNPCGKPAVTLFKPFSLTQCPQA